MSEGVTDQAQPAATDGEPAPLGPDSVAWSVFGDLTFVLGASRRLLTDVAHPIVAAGVREFSVFETDPYGRADRTLTMIMGVVYGREEALATARRLRDLHKHFKGQNPDGSRWSALNPEAFHWVHASLVHGVYTQQKVLGRGWKPGEVEQFYQEMRRVGRMYGVREQDMPVDWEAFCAWFDEMAATRLERSDITDRVLAVVAGPKAPPMIPVLNIPVVWNYTLRPIAGGTLSLINAGLLPPHLRELLGVPWSRSREIAFDTLAAISRTVVPRLPRIVRMVPQARRAVRRARRGGHSARAAQADSSERGRGAVVDSGGPVEVAEVRAPDGTRLHVEIYGRPDAPTIVLTHGVLCDLTFWRKQIADLSDEFRVVAFDHRGHGHSEQAARGRYTIDHLADDLHAVLQATVPAGEQAVLVGHSLGGIAVMAWGARYPGDVAERVRAIALVNTTPGEILDNVRFLRGPEQLLAVRRRLARTVSPLAGIPLPRRMPVRRQMLSYVALGSTTVASAGRELDRMIGATSARGRGGYGGMLVEMVTTVDPSSLDVPTLVIAGRKDKIAPPARSQLIAARLPQLIELREFDTGHCGPLECADEITASLRALGRGELGRAREATA